MVAVAGMMVAVAEAGLCLMRPLFASPSHAQVLTLSESHAHVRTLSLLLTLLLACVLWDLFSPLVETLETRSLGVIAPGSILPIDFLKAQPMEGPFIYDVCLSCRLLPVCCCCWCLCSLSQLVLLKLVLALLSSWSLFLLLLAVAVSPSILLTL